MNQRPQAQLYRQVEVHEAVLSVFYELKSHDYIKYHTVETERREIDLYDLYLKVYDDLLEDSRLEEPVFDIGSESLGTSVRRAITEWATSQPEGAASFDAAFLATAPSTELEIVLRKFLLKTKQSLVSEAGPISLASPALDLPSSVGERWVDRRAEDKTPGHFIMRVYRPWVRRGLHTGVLQKLDKALSVAYDRWLKKGALGAPRGFRRLPSSAEVKGREPDLSDAQIRKAWRQAKRKSH